MSALLKKIERKVGQKIDAEKNTSNAKALAVICTEIDALNTRMEDLHKLVNKLAAAAEKSAGQ